MQFGNAWPTYLEIFDMELPETDLSRMIDGFIVKVGNSVSWIWIALLAVIALNVFLRYVFGVGRIEFEEIQWHLYSIGFMVGLSYALNADAHVRVDVVHERLTPTTQAWIDLYGLLLGLLPFIAMMILYGIPFVLDSFKTGEISASPGGLGGRWLIKSVLVMGFVLLGLAAMSRLLRLWSFLFFKKTH